MLQASPTPTVRGLSMTKKIMCVVEIVSAMGAVTLLAQEGTTKPGEGTLMLKGKNYPLKNAVAYETTIDGEEGVAVVLSGPRISSEKLNAARKSEQARATHDSRKPYDQLEPTKAGHLKGCDAGAAHISLGRHASNATRE